LDNPQPSFSLFLQDENYFLLGENSWEREKKVQRVDGIRE
jgi:hypothetical protein